MPIEILGQTGAADVEDALRQAIREAIPDGEIEVSSGGPGHFQIRVVSPVFQGQSRVKQQQRVYGAIAHLMSGSNAPVHAIDRLECVTP
jgi:acid stress-induced BolA-like protein IbaG/YrbA